MTHTFTVGDLVELASESGRNPSLFRVLEIDDDQILLGQLSPDSDAYIGAPTAIDLHDAEDLSDLIPATDARIAMYPLARR
ncbi:hypothetical protein MUG78_16725 [Gordonia alkaliphila]|uniref:hypothetical protein n=1 Tax=Gordonia alkaliphila TaxID=1053547 RepID=UPI001FF64B37|nr:hypothetical protein [Gordonia alkaliphila]MCK0441046.1 hypothetical protein [Gordonia alkaliphila]